MTVFRGCFHVVYCVVVCHDQNSDFFEPRKTHTHRFQLKNVQQNGFAIFSESLAFTFVNDMPIRIVLNDALNACDYLHINDRSMCAIAMLHSSQHRDRRKKPAAT